MPKNAMMLSANLKYLPGCNGILNAVEYHKINTDLFVNTWPEWSKEYTSQWPKVRFKVIDPGWFPQKKMSIEWHYRFFKYNEAVKLFDEGYDVVLTWDADALPLADFSDYFDVAHKLKKVVCSTNDVRYCPPERMPTKQPYPGCSCSYNINPLFLPKEHRGVFELMLGYQYKENYMKDMMAFNYALRDYGVEHSFLVPGELWIHPSYMFPYRRYNGDRKLRLSKSSTFMWAGHKSFWRKSICNRYMKYGKTVAHNVKILNEEWNFFNKECRVKLTEGIWDHREGS